MRAKVVAKLTSAYEWAWGAKPLRATRALPGPIILYFVSLILWPHVPGPFGLWAISYFVWWFAFWPILASLSRPFATLNCLTFAIRVRVRRGGKIIIRGWSPGRGLYHVPNFACDLGDRLVYTYQPRRATPRIFMKSTGEEIAATWEEF